MEVKNKIIRMAAVTLSSAIMLTGMSSSALAQTKKSINLKDFKKQKSFAYQDNQLSTYSDGASKYNLPASVDLRDRGVVTPVKNQDPFGTCWAFGAMAASETSILSAMGKTYAETGLDLSEKHLTWFTYNALNDPYNSQNGEGIQYHVPVSSGDKYNYGALRFFASASFSQGIGPTLESDYPYAGKNKVIYRKLDDKGELTNIYYDSHDDWSLDESERFKRNYVLRDSIVYYSYADFENDDEVTYDERALEDIKYQIYLGNGVAAAYCADVSRPGETGNQEYLNQENWCQYTDEFISANHEVCIVGYDDNYPIENFNEDHRPDKPGAFLVKNSWGSGENEFPNRGYADWGIVKNGVHTGYFWLSYYDCTLEDFEIFTYDTRTNRSQTEIIDQYDFASHNGANTYETKKNSQMANVFTAAYNQELQSVSCVTGTPDVDVKYDVYLLDDKADGISNKRLASSKTVTYDYPGYHREDLKNPLKLAKGQKYMILVTETNGDGNNEIIITYQDPNIDATLYNDSNFYSNIIVNPGESYLIYGDEWYDWNDIRVTFNYNDSYGFEPDNFAIKGYSVLLDDTDVANLKVNLSSTSYVYDGTVKKPEVSIDGLTEGKDYTVAYSGNLNVGTATVTITGKGKFTGINRQHFSIVSKQSDAKPTDNKKTSAPASSKIIKLLRGRKSILVSWKRVSDAYGYQIQYSRYKNMKKAQTVNVIVNTTTKKKISKLAAKKKYYVRIRTYKNVEGKNLYSKWSPVKAVKTK